MTIKQLFRHALLFALFIGMAACGSSDTVTVVQDRPRNITPNDTTVTDADEAFREITIGLTDSVENFDPLFADNLSTMRVLSLIYDGLFTLNKSGEVIPAIADEVSVSDDELEYQIRIKSDLFFHDGPAFQSGIGRRLEASDIKWAFERAAQADVPPTASKLLMNIEGYNSYAKEQRELFEPRKRVLEEVSGIIVEDRQTIVFLLKEPDPDFTKKLASPYLFIYPREAVQSGNENLSNNPLGTGAYIFRDRSPGSITLSKDDSERSGSRLEQPGIDRVDFVTENQERTLFQQFARGDIHWIPEIGPQTSEQLIDSDGNLQPTYSDDFQVSQNEAERTHYFYFHDTDDINLSWLKNRLYEVDLSSIDFHSSFEMGEEPEDLNNNSDPDSSYLITYTDDIYVRNFLRRLQNEFIEPDATISLYEIRVPTNETAMYTRSGDSFHDTLIQKESDYWLKMSTGVIGVFHDDVSGIEGNNVPWKLFMESIRVPEQE